MTRKPSDRANRGHFRDKASPVLAAMPDSPRHPRTKSDPSSAEGSRRNVSPSGPGRAPARRPATHAPPRAPLLVVGQRAERATPARDQPTCPTEATNGQREQSRTGHPAAGRGLGSQSDPGPATARGAWPAARCPLPTARGPLSAARLSGLHRAWRICGAVECRKPFPGVFVGHACGAVFEHPGGDLGRHIEVVVEAQ